MATPKVRARAWERTSFEDSPAERDDAGKIMTPAIRIDIDVRRVSAEEFKAFDRLFWRAQISEAERLINVRKPDELERTAASPLSATELAEQQRKLVEIEALGADVRGTAALTAYRELVAGLTPTDEFVVPQDEIRRRRLAEMTAEQRATHEQLEEQDAEADLAMITAALAHIRVVPGQILVEDVDAQGQAVEVDITTGAQLLRYYGGRVSVLKSLAHLFRFENMLSEAQKKAYRSLSASTPGSSERDRTADGGSPVETAGSARPTDSVTPAAVMPTAAVPSGPTASSP